jgi:hypothetical protein
MTCEEFQPVLFNIDTTETTMIALQGASGKIMTRLPWSIWLAMLKDEATKLDKKMDSQSNSQRMNHSTDITHFRGCSGRGGCHGRLGGSGQGRGSSKESSNQVPTKVTSGIQFINKMTFIPEKYAKLKGAQKTALYDARKEARDKAPSRSIIAAAIAPAPSAAPALAPVQREPSRPFDLYPLPLLHQLQIMGRTSVISCPMLLPPPTLSTKLSRHPQPSPLVRFLFMMVLYIR